MSLNNRIIIYGASGREGEEREEWVACEQAESRARIDYKPEGDRPHEVLNQSSKPIKSGTRAYCSASLVYPSSSSLGPWEGWIDAN
jgi:hypothetical protein